METKNEEDSVPKVSTTIMQTWVHRPVVFRRIMMYVSFVEVLGTFAVLVSPGWINLKLKDDKKVVIGLFYQCGMDGPGKCARHSYMKSNWYILCYVMYIAAFLAVLVSVAYSFLAVTKRNNMVLYSAIATFTAVVALGLQLVTVGLFGDFFQSQRMCMFRSMNGKQRTLCNAIQTPGVSDAKMESVTLGLGYWGAVAITIITSFNALLGYNVTNEDVFHNTKI